MDLQALQNEINHLVYLYFTTIGVIQRDVDKDDIGSTMESLFDEIKSCRANLDRLLECTAFQPKEENKDKEKIIREAKDFIEDGLYFIDRITERHE